MTTAEDIEKAIERLPLHELARIRAWFEEFDARRFDAAIERDAQAGKLDAHADEALSARRYSLEELVDGITPDNRHEEVDWEQS
jgi:hypothetical protein